MCEYCRVDEYGEGCTTLIEYNSVGLSSGLGFAINRENACLETGVIYNKLDLSENKSVHIKYCPMCGRKL